MNRFIFNYHKSIYTDHTTARKNWYQTTTVVGHNICNNGLTNVQLRRLSFWSYTRYFIRYSSLALGLHNSVYYLLNSPAHPMYRRRLKGHLLREDYKLPYHHLAGWRLKGHLLREDYKLPDHLLAGLIIRKSTNDHRYSPEIPL